MQLQEEHLLLLLAVAPLVACVERARGWLVGDGCWRAAMQVQHMG